MSGTVREATVERKLVEGCRKAGAHAWKFVSPGRAGVPDRIVLLPGGGVIFVELKTTRGKPTELQKRTQQLLRELGMDVRILHGTVEVNEFLQEVEHRCEGGMAGEIRSVGIPGGG